MIEKSPLVRTVAFIKRNPKLSPEEFKEYWLTKHVPMVKDKLPGLKLYTGRFPLPTTSTSDAVAPPYDCLVEMGFDSVESLQAAVNGPLFASADRVKSSETFMVLPAVQTLVMEEYAVKL